MFKIREKLRLDQLVQHPKNPRKQLQTDDLVMSIKESGQLVPLLVRRIENDKFEIISGHRRAQALKEAGFLRAECDIVEMTDEQAYKALMVTNIQAQSMSELEEAEGIKNMMDTFEWTADKVAKEFGKARRWVFYRLQLLGLNPEVKEQVHARALSATHAREISQLPLDMQAEVAAKVVDEKLSTRETAEIVRQFNKPEQMINPQVESVKDTDSLDKSNSLVSPKVGIPDQVTNRTETEYEIHTSLEPQTECEIHSSLNERKFQSEDDKRIAKVHDLLLMINNFNVDIQPHISVVNDLVTMERGAEALRSINKSIERLTYLKLHIENAMNQASNGDRGEVIQFKRKAE